MATPSELVIDTFAQAREYAAEAQSQLSLFIEKLNDAIQQAPTVDVTFNPIPEPTAATVPTYTQPAEYTSTLLTTLAGVLTSRLAGGTGLPEAVETALWDRARDRESAAAQANLDTVARDAEALGYELPPGVLVEAQRRETRAYYDKIATFSREVAIQQAQLEQNNMLQAVSQVSAFESSLTDIIAKRQNVALEEFRADVQRFQAEVEQEVKHWEALSRQYEAQANFVMNAAKINADITRANLSAVLEASKAGAQVFAQLTAAAYSLMRVSASVSGSASNSVSFSYSNDTTESPPPVTAV